MPTPEPNPFEPPKSEPEKAEEKPLVEEVQPEKKPELPKAAPLKPAGGDEKKPSGGEADIDNRKAGFFNMITGFLGFLNLRKQAYTGKPASAMYYDEKKGRYVIVGEEESDDDEPPPPPPGAKKMGVSTDAAKSETKKEPEETGANSLTAVGFAGALSNRGRGRGARARGGRAMPASRFPQTFDASSITQTEKPKVEEAQEAVNQTALYQTALDISKEDAINTTILPNADESMLAPIAEEPAVNSNQESQTKQDTHA